MPGRNKTIIFLGDGMADEAVDQLDGRTPLQCAPTPAMDAIARDGTCGTLLTLPDAFPTSSDVANMSVLGCDLETEFSGRGPLEAAGRGIALDEGDIAFRLNLTTVEDGILTDFSGGHIAPQDATALVEALGATLARPGVRFHTGVSYRNLLVLSGSEFSTEVTTEKPDDNQGNPIREHLPRASSPRGERTAALLRELMDDATDILEAHPVNQAARREGRPPANGIWPWSGGAAGALRALDDKYGIRGAVISAVDVINGLGRCLGMDVIPVAGATGYIDTNYEGKADAAIAALETHDLVYLHVEAVDEVSHAGDVDLKIKTIAEFDRRVVGRVLNAVGEDITAVVLPDHPVPVALRKHTRTPVPVAVRMTGLARDPVETFSETSGRAGRLGAMVNGDLMALLFGKPAP